MNMFAKNADFFVNLLITQVEKKFKAKVIFANINELAFQIEYTTGRKLSASTLQRFFSLVKHNSLPSVFTLNVLSSYCGYVDWYDFQTKNKGKALVNIEDKVIPDDFGLVLFELCLKNHQFDTVMEYLDLLPNKKVDYKTQIKIGDSLGKHIRSDIKTREVLLPLLAKNPNGRLYFYENFVDIDYLNVYFSSALNSLYLPNSNFQNKPKYLADYAFVHALTFIAHVRANKKKEAIKVAYDLFKKIPVETAFQELAHPFPFARILSVYLISEKLKNKLSSSTLDFVNMKLHQLMQVANNHPFILAQVIMALNYCKCYHEIIALYRQYNTIFLTHMKTSYDYLPIVQCVNNAYEMLKHEKELQIVDFELHFENVKRSSSSKIVLI